MFSVRGADKVCSNLDKVLEDILEAANTAVIDNCAWVSNLAQDLVPVDTGNLRASLFVAAHNYENNPYTQKTVAWNTKRNDTAQLSREHTDNITEYNRKVESEYSSKLSVSGYVGYSAYYALETHETDKKYKRSGAKFKYLAKGLEYNVAPFRRDLAEYVERVLK